MFLFKIYCNIYLYYYSISGDRFEFLVKSIQDLFPAEDKARYYSYKKKDVKSVIGPSGATGILYTKYKKLRLEAAKVKIFVPLKKQYKQAGSLTTFFNRCCNFFIANLKMFWLK